MITNLNCFSQIIDSVRIVEFNSIDRIFYSVKENIDSIYSATPCKGEIYDFEIEVNIFIDILMKRYPLCN